MYNMHAFARNTKKGEVEMKRKKIIAVLLAFCMVLSIAACNKSSKRSDDDDDDETIEETEDDETSDTSETSESTEKTERTEKSEETTESTTAEPTATSAERAQFVGKVVDFDDMHFFVNGKKYTLGQVTLQEMIDDGVPFDESDLKYKDEMLKKNSQSFNGFGITLDKFWSAQVYVMNLSDSEKPMKDCTIYRIYLPSLDSGYQNGANLSFDFPLDITMAELEATAGKPDDGVQHYDGDNGYYTDTYTYKKKSEQYLGSKEFEFEFKKGVIYKIALDYIP